MSDYKTGTCKWCGDKGAVFRDNSLCDRCDRCTVFCSICDERVSDENKCRHVFEDRNFEWSGSGIGLPHPKQGIKEAVFELLTRMPTGFAAELAAAIRSGKFYTWLIAPLIGSGGLLEMHGMSSFRLGLDYGDAIMRLGQETDCDNKMLADGYRWLVSLYKTDTPDANAITLLWIDEWREMREWALYRLADDGCPLAALP